MGSISVREHIRWGTDPPSEPTSTLVLTSPGRRFVDIRVLRTALNGLQQEPNAPLSPHEKLDWAFAGTSSTAQVTRADGSQLTHATFHHWVDSRTRQPDEVLDEGDMFPQPGGSTLETGHMTNPATGLGADYEELWRDEEPQPVPGLARCTVLQLHHDTDQTRGLFVQLGQHAQVVLRNGHVFTAARWIWDGSESRWKTLFCVGAHGNHSLEDLIHSSRTTLQKDERFVASSGTWTVVETVR